MKFYFHEESFILAEKTQSAGIANSLTGDTLCDIFRKIVKMEIFLTNKLSELIQPTKLSCDQNSNEKWSAHIFVLSRKKNIIFTHKETLYSFFVLDVSKKDLKYLPERIVNELGIQLEADGVDSKLAYSYFEIPNVNGISFLKTDNDQKTLGWMKDLIQINQLFFDDYKQNPIISSAYFAHNNMNDRLVGARKYQSPLQMLQDKLI